MSVGGDTAGFLLDLELRGVVLIAAPAGNLSVKNAHKLRPHERQRVIDEKPAIFALLRSREPEPPPPAPLPPIPGRARHVKRKLRKAKRKAAPTPAPETTVMSPEPVVTAPAPASAPPARRHVPWGGGGVEDRWFSRRGADGKWTTEFVDEEQYRRNAADFRPGHDASRLDLFVGPAVPPEPVEEQPARVRPVGRRGHLK